MTIPTVSRSRQPGSGRQGGPSLPPPLWRRVLTMLVMWPRRALGRLRGTAHIPQVADCIFCQKDNPDLNRVLRENTLFYARYDNYPATEGHVEIVPKRHVVSFFSLTPREIRSAYALMRKVQQELADLYSPDGYTIGINEGEASGRSIDHLHIHLIPRYKGDVPDPRGGIRQIVPNWDPDSWHNPLTDG